MHNKILDEVRYEEILVNWENSKPNFMLWLKYCCGVNNDLYSELDELIRNDDDLDRWIHHFDGNFDNVLETTQLFKSLK